MRCCRGWPMSMSDTASTPSHGLIVHRWSGEDHAFQGLPLVLLHGWGADSRSWRPLIAALQEQAVGSSIEAIDLPGFGDSPVCDATLPSLLSWLATALPPRCILVGWSLGGMLATMLAERWPERIAALVTIATNACYVVQPDWPHAMPAATFKAFYSAFSTDAMQCLKRFGALQAHGDHASRTVTKYLREWQRVPDEERQHAWLRSLDLLRELDLRPALKTLTLPVLHVFGAGDALVPVAVADQFSVDARRQVRVMEGCGHAPHISQPTGLAELIDTFLRDVLPTSGHTHGEQELVADDLLDKQSVARSFSRAAAQYDSVAHLQRRLGEQLLTRLPIAGEVDNDAEKGSEEGSERGVTAGTTRVLDLGCGTGYFLPRLQAAFPTAELFGGDLAQGMVAHARRQRAVSAAWLCADAEHLPFADGTFDLIFSNLVFQWCEDVPQLASELYRALSPQGRAVFTTLGPDTLAELRQAWATVDDAVHVNRFPDSGVVRRALISAGFNSVSVDATCEVVHYPVLAHLLRELKTLGANNINRGRPSTLTGRARIRALEAAYEVFRDAAGLPATWEVYFIVVGKDA